MAVTGTHTCDFAVWTPSDFVVITVLFDEGLWNNHCYPTLKHFLFIPHATRNSLP